ncbi:hypothetical protein [Micromonospora sonneratiae]
MSEYDQPQRLPALGRPAVEADEPVGDPDGDPDFASEHDKTAVAEDIITGTEPDPEPESPRGWSGMER